MMQGKIIQDERGYVIKMGGVTIDITADVRNLLAHIVTQEQERSAEIIAQERARLAAIVERYNQIASIVLTDHRPGPIGGQESTSPCPWAPTG